MEYNWQDYTVLITEDDEISYKYIELVLSRKTNINIIWAVNGKQAVEYCQLYEHIDIILMDIQLPDIDGYEAARQIKTFRPNLPIIVQSANAYNDEWEKCLATGCDAYVSKPIDLYALFSKIDNLLDKVPTR
jgi:CheY-like chemotaxis protein